ncbi:flagellar hook assembly protein FlgD [Sphingomonas bacterium]|uniref:flagellar hook assembly protein FlgD n=1 Tax=Sphingomonas bacterium TaxID=1895847 RepID=UPI0015774EF8|nr:flagellar hook capping FlgD N-terminal domain-containing protein [Sphingomonas bacterium]
MTSTSAFDTTLAGLGITRSATGPSVAAASTANTTLGQADFLKLMTAQMQNQDPFSPVDNTQMVAQMAQFSSLAGISDMSTTLKAISTKLGATSTADALAYVGKTVLTAGDTAYGRTTGGLAGAVELGDAASEVNLTISDASGQIVHAEKLGAHTAGTVGYDWSGKDASGADAGTGPFTVSITAADNGKAVTATNLVWAPVESVSTASGSAVLTLPGLGTVPVTAVRQVG